jgi:hypothetical protein
MTKGAKRTRAEEMVIDDAAMVQHIDALLRDFVADNRTLFDFWGDLPTESARSEAGWQSFRDGDLRLRDDESLPRLELNGDLDSRKIARRQNLKWWHAFEALQIAGAVDPFFSMAD